MKRNRIFNIIVLVLFIICFVELFYKLGDIPYGINGDEAGSMYDAISLSRYGVDRYLYHNPVYFINYGDGQNALYTYLAIISMRLFGISLFSFRLVNVVISLVSYYYFYKLLIKYDTKIKGVFVLLLLTILPIYIMKARWGLESYLFNPLLIISLYYFISAIDSKKNRYYFFSGILFGITLYTYAVSYLILPLFLGIVIIFLIIRRSISIKNIFAFGIPLFLLAFPLILMLLINNGYISEIRIQFFSIPKLFNYRGSEVSISNVNISNIFQDFLVIFTGDWLPHNTISGFGVMYYISPLLIFMGIVLFIRNKEYNNVLGFVMISLFISNMLVFIFIYGLNVNKCNSIYICLVYFIAYFFEYLFVDRKKIFFTFCICFYLISYILFIRYYFDVYDINYFMKGDYFDALEKANDIYSNGNYSCIFVNGDNSDRVYVSLYYRVSPYDYGNSLKYIYDIDSIDDNVIYIANRDKELYEVLVEKNFIGERIGNYYVMYN